MHQLHTVELMQIVDISGEKPVILHTPLGGRTIPAEHLSSYVISLAELEAEKDLMTHHHTGVLVAGIARASTVLSGFYQFAFDVERFPDGSEELNEVGVGVFYTHGSHGQEIRRVKTSATVRNQSRKII